MACFEGVVGAAFLSDSSARISSLMPICLKDGVVGMKKVLQTQYRSQMLPLLPPSITRSLSSRSAAPPQAVSCRWWPRVEEGPAGEPLFRFERPEKESARGEGSGGPYSFEASPSILLERALALASACEAIQKRVPSPKHDPNWKVELAMEKEGATVWTIQVTGASTPITCSQAFLKNVPLEAVLYSIFDTKERMRWDSGSFLGFSALQKPRPCGNALGDVIFCRMPGPPSIADRYVVQERFLIKLPPDEHGNNGFAIVMSSPSQTVIDHLFGSGQALSGDSTTGAVQATTVMSAYLIREIPDKSGVVLTSMSQTDLGGNIPPWVQSMAKKAGKTHFLRWIARLSRHIGDRIAQASMSPLVESMVSSSDGQRKSPSSESSSEVVQHRGCLGRWLQVRSAEWSCSESITVIQMLLVLMALYLLFDISLSKGFPNLLAIGGSEPGQA